MEKEEEKEEEGEGERWEVAFFAVLHILKSCEIKGKLFSIF